VMKNHVLMMTRYISRMSENREASVNTVSPMPTVNAVSRSRLSGAKIVVGRNLKCVMTRMIVSGTIESTRLISATPTAEMTNTDRGRYIFFENSFDSWVCAAANDVAVEKYVQYIDPIMKNAGKLRTCCFRRLENTSVSAIMFRRGVIMVHATPSRD